MVGAELGNALGVRQPAVVLLHASQLIVDLQRSSGDAELVEFADAFERLGLLVFGSRYLGGVTQKWDVALRGVVDDADAYLARLLVFDAFIENGDRSSATNPNLLVSNGRLFAIDHGQALPAVQGVRGKRLPYAVDSHLAWDVVRERPQLLEEPIASLRELPDSAIDAAVAAVPSGWWTEAGRHAAVRAALVARRDVLPDILTSLKERLP